ncbi:ABC transporter substrate-binding protein [Mameliella sediminis]|uniref:ABC transporter substrate-binding protein n=1 Tax=Mameliella sediminis TaxID=2836866 RepID=UPI001C484022|nr:ABC transporter substrate-binding protein [Mameliella sediminis]MBV7395745.1 ABC transporter substrate-binding protein [Mameliella sediminis]
MTIKTMLSAAAICAGLGSSAAWADCGEVSITEMDWASSAVVTSVAKFLLENGYGCTVKTVPSSTTPAMASIAETGEPDILTELWTNSSPVYEELRAAGKLVELGHVLADGGVEAWWIPAYLAEAHPELRTLEGILANPQLVGGRFHDCPAGWACDVVNLNNAKAVDMPGHGIERFQHGSGETLATAIAAAYAAKEPWFGYYWAPTSVLGKYPMVQVETAPFDQDAHTCNADPDCTAPKLSAYPTAKVVTAVAPDLLEREPEVVEFLKLMSFTNEQMGAVLAWQDDNSASYEEAAVYFLTTYQDTWANWLNDEARSRLSALLQ